MTLLGEGIITIWNDIKEGGVDAFYAWHDNEHMAERVGIPGFRRGRRYIALAEGIRWFTLYEAVSPEVLAGQDYLSRLNAPTPWTRETVVHFTNVTRGLNRRLFSLARGDGADLLAMAVADADLAALREALSVTLLPRLFADQRIVGVHYLETDAAASGIETAEKRGREGGTGIPRAVVLIEASRLEPLEAARPEIEAALEHAGGRTLLPTALYRQEFQRLPAGCA